MSFIFDIVIPHKSIDTIRLTEILVHWGDDVFSQNPPQYTYDSELTFEQLDNVGYYNEYFGQHIDVDFNAETHIALNLKGTHIWELEMLINTNGQKISSSKLIPFLVELCKLDIFYLFLIHDEENIENKYTIRTEEELISKIFNCLSWSSPEGALICKS